MNNLVINPIGIMMNSQSSNKMHGNRVPNPPATLAFPPVPLFECQASNGTDPAVRAAMIVHSLDQSFVEESHNPHTQRMLRAFECTISHESWARIERVRSRKASSKEFPRVLEAFVAEEAQRCCYWARFRVRNVLRNLRLCILREVTHWGGWEWG